MHFNRISCNEHLVAEGWPTTANGCQSSFVVTGAHKHNVCCQRGSWHVSVFRQERALFRSGYGRNATGRFVALLYRSNSNIFIAYHTELIHSLIFFFFCPRNLQRLPRKWFTDSLNKHCNLDHQCHSNVIAQSPISFSLNRNENVLFNIN